MLLSIERPLNLFIIEGMEIKRIKINTNPPSAATTQAPPTRPEKAPIDLSRFYDGSSADTFLKDEPHPPIEDPDLPHDEGERKMSSARITSSTHVLEPQERPAIKTMELSHLSHLSYLPTQKVTSPSGSLLNQMKGEGEDQAALYARYAAALSDMDKKKKKKKKRWRKLWDFFRSLFEK